MVQLCGATHAVSVSTDRPARAAATGERRHGLARDGDGADESVVEVRDVNDAPTAIDGDASRVVKLGRAAHAVSESAGRPARAAAARERRHGLAQDGDGADEVVGTVRDVDGVTRAVHRDTRRKTKSGRAPHPVRVSEGRAARAATTRKRRHALARDEDGADEVVGRVRDVNDASTSIDGDASREVKLGRAAQPVRVSGGRAARAATSGKRRHSLA